ncbi:Acetyltransferase (GNAT) family protein [Streptomyces sp. DvalAA-14]|uniref:GNAT family N-acetyltransferase n=1 Tax=unclassified Streptomyces TaxID=2593676 RepID=UPI00081B32C4|nr:MULTISPECIES: GNAT family N-acetyltransferase [unclassified Streptomyces]MYS23152.1 GNAT family N-acetyltransferase [Streptomyces sp. SID4948]SCE28346.1 Acetyltransferase (GNAT) family protein [Streptomyces sp. DvalAA-14]
MRHSTPAQTRARQRHWGRDLAEVAALFTAMAAADFVADLVNHGPDGGVLLATSSLGLLGAAGFHTWWTRRHSHAPPGPPETAPAGTETTLWRLRTTLRDTPGSLGEVCTALAGSRVDIVTLQTHPLADGTVDEFLLRAPAALPAAALALTVADAGGADTWLERADAHDLVDAPTRMLALATRTALDPAELPLALRELFGRCTISSTPATPGGAAGSARDDAAEEPGVQESPRPTVMRLRDPSGGTIVVRRDHLPFTPTEFARARALVELDARLGVRMPARRDVLTLPEGNEITVRRAGSDDHAAALAMHDRCSPATLSSRYHGPVGDADRYLAHLLSPRFGRTLAVETASGRLVALGHLLWDGDENEVALIVEDDWQRRGIGAALLRRLVELAAEAGRDSVYAVTRSSNTAMVATMRELDLPLDYQLEDGTLVITAALPSASGTGPAPAALPWVTGPRR